MGERANESIQKGITTAPSGEIDEIESNADEGEKKLGDIEIVHSLRENKCRHPPPSSKSARMRDKIAVTWRGGIDKSGGEQAKSVVVPKKHSVPPGRRRRTQGLARRGEPSILKGRLK